MLRSFASKVVSVSRAASKTQLLKSLTVTGVQKCNYETLPDDGVGLFESELIDFLKLDTATGYEIRRVMNEIQGMDFILSPPAIEAFMRACRRNNDYALAIRILESVRFKCNDDQLYNNLIQSVRPTLDELGILSLEQMGYDKPELFLPSVFDIHK